MCEQSNSFDQSLANVFRVHPARVKETIRRSRGDTSRESRSSSREPRIVALFRSKPRRDTSPLPLSRTRLMNTSTVSDFSSLAARAHIAPRASALRAASSLPAARGRGGLVVRADGGSGINLSGFPFLLARKAGFDTSEGIAGFTPFAELFIGRTAMGGFATGLAQELITGDGILAQIGWRDQPNEGLFSFLLAFLATTTLAGVAVTFKQMSSGEMSNAQFRRYQNFLGLSPKDERARMEATREAQRKELDGAALADELAAAAAAATASPGATLDEAPELSPRQEEDVTTAYLRTVELDNARWAMVGFFAAVLMEAKTGGGIIPQGIMYGKMLGLLGPDSGF